MKRQPDFREDRQRTSPGVRRGKRRDGVSQLDVQPYREELSYCSPALREIARGVAQDMRGYMEERV